MSKLLHIGTEKLMGALRKWPIEAIVAIEKKEKGQRPHGSYPHVAYVYCNHYVLEI